MPRIKQNLDELSINQLSRLTGKTYRTIKTALAPLAPVREDKSTFYYKPKDALKLIYSPDATGNVFDFNAERARLAKEQADAREMENRVLRNELVPIKVISDALSKVGEEIRTILEGIPLRLKQQCPRLSASEIQVVKREIVKAQNHAAEIQLPESG